MPTAPPWLDEEELGEEGSPLRTPKNPNAAPQSLASSFGTRLETPPRTAEHNAGSPISTGMVSMTATPDGSSKEAIQRQLSSLKRKVSSVSPSTANNGGGFGRGASPFATPPQPDLVGVDAFGTPPNSRERSTVSLSSSIARRRATGAPGAVDLSPMVASTTTPTRRPSRNMSTLEVTPRQDRRGTRGPEGGQAKQKVSAIIEGLKDEENWQQRQASVGALSECLLETPDAVVAEGVGKVLIPLLHAAECLRSGVSKDAIDCIGTMATALQHQLDPFVDVIVENLSTKALGNKFLVEAAYSSMHNVVCNTTESHVMGVLIRTAAKTKADKARAVVYKGLVDVLERWGDGVLSWRNPGQLLDVIGDMAVDAHPDTRQNAATAVQLLVPAYGGQDRLKAAIDVSITNPTKAGRLTKMLFAASSTGTAGTVPQQSPTTTTTRSVEPAPPPLAPANSSFRKTPMKMASSIRRNPSLRNPTSPDKSGAPVSTGDHLLPILDVINDATDWRQRLENLTKLTTEMNALKGALHSKAEMRAMDVVAARCNDGNSRVQCAALELCPTLFEKLSPECVNALVPRWIGVFAQALGSSSPSVALAADQSLSALQKSCSDKQGALKCVASTVLTSKKAIVKVCLIRCLVELVKDVGKASSCAALVKTAAKLMDDPQHSVRQETNRLLLVMHSVMGEALLDHNDLTTDQWKRIMELVED